jgi:hypothetical protein
LQAVNSCKGRYVYIVNYVFMPASEQEQRWQYLYAVVRMVFVFACGMLRAQKK